MSPKTKGTATDERAREAERVAAMFARWASEPDDPAEPDWDVEQIERISFRGSQGGADGDSDRPSREP